MSIETRSGDPIDINTLTANGVRVVGGLGRMRDGVAQFSGSLGNMCALADLKMNRLLDTIDEWATEPRDSTTTSRSSPIVKSIDLDTVRSARSSGAWATSPDYSWLEPPVLDRHQRIPRDSGSRRAPGAYLLGSKVLRRRSTFINGAEHNTLDLREHLRRFLDTDQQPPPHHTNRRTQMSWNPYENLTAIIRHLTAT